MNNKTHKTKIIFTIGPATDSEEVLEKLIHAGVDICRINQFQKHHYHLRAFLIFQQVFVVVCLGLNFFRIDKTQAQVQQ